LSAPDTYKVRQTTAVDCLYYNVTATNNLNTENAKNGTHHF